MTGIHRLDIAFRTLAAIAAYHVVEGAAYSLVGGRRLEWEDKDVFTVATWTFCQHVNSGDRPAFLSGVCEQAAFGRVRG